MNFIGFYRDLEFALCILASDKSDEKDTHYNQDHKSDGYYGSSSYNHNDHQHDRYHPKTQNYKRCEYVIYDAFRRTLEFFDNTDFRINTYELKTFKNITRSFECAQNSVTLSYPTQFLEFVDDLLRFFK